MAPPAPATTTFEPDTKYRLLLRVQAAEDLAHKSTQGAYCKLYVGDTALLDGSHKKLLKSASSESNGDAPGGSSDAVKDAAHNSSDKEHRIFRTQTRAAAPDAASGRSETLWDETFEVSLRDPNVEVLSLRVKSQHRFFCPVVGTFAVYLRHLRVGLQADQWFPLRRGKKETGRIRLTLLITPEHAPLGRAKKRNGSDMAPDAKVALAASFEADRAIQRLVNKQLKDEEERKQRRQNGDERDDDDALAQQMEVLAVAKVKEPAAKLGSGRGEPRFPVLLPTSPSLQPQSNQADVHRGRVDIAAATRDERRNGDALGGSGRGGARFPVTSPAGGASRSPVGSGPSMPQRAAFFGAVDTQPTGAPAAVNGSRLSDLERERRRAANFARLKDLDAVESVEVGVPVGSGRGGGSSRRRSLPGDGQGGSQRAAHGFYSIPSFGPGDVESRRSKRHSAASSTDSDSLADYERRLDRKLRKVRRETEKLRKLRRQLRKYIPDLSDSESEDASSSSSSGDSNNKQQRQQHRRSSQREPQEAPPRAAVTSSRFYV